MEQIAIMLPKNMIDELNALSEKMNLPRSNIIRFAIMKYLEEEKEKEVMQQFIGENFSETEVRKAIKIMIREMRK